MPTDVASQMLAEKEEKGSIPEGGRLFFIPLEGDDISVESGKDHEL